MPLLNSLRHFPMVKMIPLSILDTDRKGFDGETLGCLFASAIGSLKDMESIWKTDHNATELKDRFRKLYYQLDSLKKYCESDDKPSQSSPDAPSACAPGGK